VSGCRGSRCADFPLVGIMLRAANATFLFVGCMYVYDSTCLLQYDTFGAHAGLLSMSHFSLRVCFVLACVRRGMVVLAAQQQGPGHTSLHLSNQRPALGSLTRCVQCSCMPFRTSQVRNTLLCSSGSSSFLMSVP
jgi:hypothetical protein